MINSGYEFQWANLRLTSGQTREDFNTVFDGRNGFCGSWQIRFEVGSLEGSLRRGSGSVIQEDFGGQSEQRAVVPVVF